MNPSLSTKRVSLVYCAVTVSLTVVAIVLRFLNLAFFFDSSIHYYRPDSLLPILEWVVLTAGTAFAAVISFLSLRRLPIFAEEKQPRPVKAFAIVAAVGFLVLAASTLGTTGSLISTLLSMGACLYFLLIFGNQTKPLPLTLSGLCVIVRLLWVLAESYFDVTVPMNSPNKLILELACLSGMLFLVEELRTLISKARPALYPFSLGVTVLLTGTASIPSLLGHFAKVIDLSDLLAANVALLTLFLYAVCRLLLLTLRAPVEAIDTEEPISVEQASLNEAVQESIEESDPQV